METAPHQAARLLLALDELIEREGTFLRGGYYDLAVETRGRAEPLARQLANLAAEPGLEAYWPRVAALQARNAEHDALINAKMIELAAELRHIEEARRRAAQVAPAYGCVPDPAPVRWQAAV